MEIVYTDNAKQSGEGTVLQKATRQLQEILGASQDLVKAVWDRVEDEQGRSLYVLRLSDFTGEAKAKFAPDELQQRTHMRVRFSSLWGDLLNERNKKQLQQLQDSEGLED